MEIYKIKITNEDLKGQVPILYFQERKSADATIKVFDEMLKKGKTLEWDLEVIYVMSHQEAYQQFINLAESL